MTQATLRRRGARSLLVGAAAAVATAAAVAPAQAAVTLDWSTVNVFDSEAPRDTQRTWLGYVTDGGRFRSNGTAAPIPPATGPTVTPASPRGADQAVTWSLPAVSGSFNPLTLQGTLEFDGGVRFTSPSPAPAVGHGFTISLEKPQIQMTGAGNGVLYASGVHTPGSPGSDPVPYDRSQPVLDLRDGAWLINADGSSSVTFTPSVAVTGYTFPTNYVAGAGPERTPNTFGALTIKIPANVGPQGPVGPTGPKGDTGAVGPKGDRGPAGKNGVTRTIRIQTTTLARAPFKGKAKRKVRVTARKSKRTLATGTVKGRKLTVTLAPRVRKKQLKGRYVLRLVGKRGAAVVRL